MKFGVGLVMAQTETILKSLPAVVKANGVDALVIDTVQFYAELGAIQLGMPYIHVSNALQLDFSGYTPICYYDWPHPAPLTLKVLISLRSSITPVHSMMAWAGRSWISPGSD